MTAARQPGSDADRSAMPREWTDRPVLLLVVAAVAYLPFTLLGFGTDIDVPNVLRSGRAAVDDGRYEMSRGPGAVVHEVATGALDRIGGSVLVNLSSLAFALLCLWCVQALLRRDGARWPVLGAAVLAASPWFWIAATSLGDFTWALGLVLAGAVASQRERPVLAGLLFALAIGCRASSGLLVAAWLVSQQLGNRDDRPDRSATVRTIAVTAGLGVLCFVPPWLQADRTTAFLDNELEFVGVVTHFGRWATKNLAVIGVLGVVVLVVGVRPLLAGLRRWPYSVVVRFAVLVIVATELLFFRLPFKPAHLLPAVAAVALLVGSSPAVSRRWIGALVAVQLLAGVVGTTIAAPDVVDEASTGSLDLGLTAGVLLTDVRCRLDDRERGPWSEVATPAAIARGEQNAACTAQSWRADP